MTFDILVKAGEDTTVMLDFVDKAFNEMTFLVAILVIVSWFNTVLFGWNDHFRGELVMYRFDDSITAPIRNDVLGNDVCEYTEALELRVHRVLIPRSGSKG